MSGMVVGYAHVGLSILLHVVVIHYSRPTPASESYIAPSEEIPESLIFVLGLTINIIIRSAARNLSSAV